MGCSLLACNLITIKIYNISLNSSTSTLNRKCFCSERFLRWINPFNRSKWSNVCVMQRRNISKWFPNYNLNIMKWTLEIFSFLWRLNSNENIKVFVQFFDASKNILFIHKIRNNEESRKRKHILAGPCLSTEPFHQISIGIDMLTCSHAPTPTLTYTQMHWERNVRKQKCCTTFPKVFVCGATRID